MLYVENRDSGDVSVVDPVKQQVVRTISLDRHAHPDDLVTSRDGKTLYVNCGYAAGHSHPDALADEGHLIAIDTASGKELWRATIRGKVEHLVISPDDRYIYNALFDRWYVARIDLQTQAVEYLPVQFLGGHGVRISSDGRRLYVGSILMPEMNVIDLDSRNIPQRIFFRDPVRPFDVTQDERTAFVQTSFLHGFHVVDLADGEIRETVHLPELPADTPVEKSWPNTIDHGLELTPDETRLVALATTGNYVAFYDVSGMKLMGTVAVGREPSWVVVDGDGQCAYVSSRRSDEVSIIEVESLKEVGRTKVGNHPQRMWLANNPKRAAA